MPAGARRQSRQQLAGAINTRTAPPSSRKGSLSGANTPRRPAADDDDDDDPNADAKSTRSQGRAGTRSRPPGSVDNLDDELRNGVDPDDYYDNPSDIDELAALAAEESSAPSRSASVRSRGGILGSASPPPGKSSMPLPADFVAVMKKAAAHNSRMPIPAAASSYADARSPRTPGGGSLRGKRPSQLTLEDEQGHGKVY